MTAPAGPGSSAVPRESGSHGSSIPGATYRLQLGARLTFADARDLVPYLAELGITDCYLSPILQPCAPESHGYDVADHGQLNQALAPKHDLGMSGPQPDQRGSGRVGYP
jgi:(1->4)-alpha-D-glucan 1-alpha-D-glucosylmutase